MNSRLAVAMLAIMSGCHTDPAGIEEIAEVAVLAPADSIQLGDSVTIPAEVRDASGRLLSNSRVRWSSSNPAVLEIGSAGEVRALRPGFAWITAQAAGRSDSAGIRVVTSHCSPVDLVWASQNGYWGTLVLAGSLRNAETSSGLTEYHGTPFFWASGLVYGTHPTDMQVGYDYHLGYRDFGGGLCRDADRGGHSVSLLEPTRRMVNRPNGSVPGLMVVQDHWVFDDEANDDFIIIRYSFINTGSAPVAGLRVGFVADHDVDGTANVGSFDAHTGVASVVAADSANQTLTAGMVLLGSEIGSYLTSRSAGASPARSDYFSFLEPRPLTSSRSDVYDVKQILAAVPFTLAAGETRAIGYALVAGADRADFESNVSAARARALQLW